MNRPRPFAARPDTRFVELARQRAIDTPNESVDTSLVGGLSYDQLDRRARAVAARLQTRVRPGGRVLIQGSAEELVIGVFACLYAGLVAVPCATSSRLDDRAAEVAASLALTSGTSSQVPALSPLDVADDEAADWRATFPDHHTPALLRTVDGQLVLLTHGDLLANLRDIRSALGVDSARDVALLAVRVAG